MTTRVSESTFNLPLGFDLKESSLQALPIAQATIESNTAASSQTISTDWTQKHLKILMKASECIEQQDCSKEELESIIDELSESYATTPDESAKAELYSLIQQASHRVLKLKSPTPSQPESIKPKLDSELQKQDLSLIKTIEVFHKFKAYITNPSENEEGWAKAQELTSLDRSLKSRSVTVLPSSLEYLDLPPPLPEELQRRIKEGVEIVTSKHSSTPAILSSRTQEAVQSILISGSHIPFKHILLSEEELAAKRRALEEAIQNEFLPTLTTKEPLEIERAYNQFVHSKGFETFTRPKGIPKDSSIEFVLTRGTVIYETHKSTSRSIIVRIMPANPYALFDSQKTPYVRCVINKGLSLSAEGTVVQHKSGESHIPHEEFNYRKIQVNYFDYLQKEKEQRKIKKEERKIISRAKYPPKAITQIDIFDNSDFNFDDLLKGPN